MKRILVMMTVILVLVTAVGNFTGCRDFSRPVYEDGYYRYYIFEYKDGIGIEIIGLTESGREQKILVIPENIKGIKVSEIRHRYPLAVHPADFASENLEKVFFPTSGIIVADGTLKNATNFKKAIIINYDMYSVRGGGSIYKGMNGKFHYIPKTAYDAGESRYFDMKFANVTYYYNFETEINHGCYWIDDVDYGETIEYVPTDPVRNGYSFGGWYQESECVTPWNFESDTLPELRLDEDETIVYQETKLYAKWVQQ